MQKFGSGFGQSSQIQEELDATTSSILEQIRNIVVYPLRISEISTNVKAFIDKYKVSSEALTRIRKGIKASKNTVKPGYKTLYKEFLGILKTFQEETLPKALSDFTKLIDTYLVSKNTANTINCLTKIITLGIESFCCMSTLLHVLIKNSQHEAKDIMSLRTSFKEMNELILNNPSLIMIAESEDVFVEHKQKKVGLHRAFKKMYRKVLKIMKKLKKEDELSNEADYLLNILEQAYVQLIDSSHNIHNSLGFDILIYILSITDEKYHESVFSLIKKWHSTVGINNIGRIYETLFLYGNENIRDCILDSLCSIPTEEVLNFFSLLDPKLFEGYVEEGLVLTDEATTPFNFATLNSALNLTDPIKLKLAQIMNDVIGDDLVKTFEKVSKGSKDHCKKFYDLLKIASVSVHNPIFIDGNGLAKIHEILLQIIDEILSNPNKYEIHYTIIQVIVDIFHGMFRAMKFDTCERIIDIILNSGDEFSMLFSARLGNILHCIDKNKSIQKSLLHKAAKVYNKMLSKTDFLQKYKALEGIMLTANNSELDPEDLAVIVPSSEEDKELLRRVADPSEDTPSVNDILAKDLLSSMFGRIREEKENFANQNQKFNDLNTKHPFELQFPESKVNNELNETLNKLEEALIKLKENPNTTNEFAKLHLQNRIYEILEKLE